MGRHISRALLDDDHEVTVLSRTPAKVSRIEALTGANATRGDVTERESLTGTLEGADAVVMAVQFPNHPIEVPRKGLTYDRYDRQGTVNLLAEAQRAGGVRFLYVSGASANPASEKTWYRAKGLAERAIVNSGLEHVIVRPSWAYGPGDRALNRFAAIARLSPVIPQPGASPQRIQPIYAGDVGSVFARIVERGAYGGVFEIGSREVMTMNEVVRTLVEVMDKKRLIVPVPKSLVKLATAPLVALPNPPMSPAGVDFATQDGLVDISRAVRELDFDPLSLREGLERYIRP